MNQKCRNNSPTSVLVIAILLCSIVCSVTDVFGRVIPAQSARIIRKEATSTQLTTQLAEKVESESDTKHSIPLFVIQTVLQLSGLDLDARGYSGLVYATRFGGCRNIVPLYLVERTIRI